MPRRSNLLRAVRIAIAALLGAAALLCAGLWIVDALSPPSPIAGAWMYHDPGAIRLDLGRYDLAVRLGGAGLQFRCDANACFYCDHFLPDHAPDCSREHWGDFPMFRRSRHLDAVGVNYSDYWAAPTGLMWVDLEVPLWLLITFLAPYPLYVLISDLLRRHWRRRPGACIACGYDLTGNVSGICPECGRPAVAAP